MAPAVRPRGLERAGEAALALFDALWKGPLGVALLDAELRFLAVNEVAAGVNGLAEREHLGRRMSELFPSRADALAPLEARMREVLDTGRAAADVVVQGRLADGAPREYRCSCLPVAGPDGAVRGICALIADATDERRRAAALGRGRREAERAVERLRLLQGITAALSAAVEPAQVADVLVSRVPRAIGAEAGSIRRLVDGELVLVAASGPTPDRSPRALPLGGESAPAACVRRAEPLWLEAPEDALRQSPRLAGEAPPGPPGAWVVLPLVARGRAIGSLDFTFDGPRTFDLEERAFVLSVAQGCAQALDRALLHEAERAQRAAAQRATELLRRLQAVTAALSAARTVEEVGAVIAREVHAAFGAGAATAHLIDAPAGRLRLLAAAGPPAVCPERLEAVPLDADLPLPRAARTGDALWIEGGAEQEAASPALARGGDGCASSVALPLHACGVPVGVLGLAFGEPRRFQPDERALLASVAEACGQALERAALFDRERGARTAEARTRALLDALVEHAPVGIGFLDRDFRFARVNRVLAEIDGLPAEAHLGRLPRELFPGIPMERIEASWRRVLETGEPLVDVPVEGETPAAPGRRRQWVESWYPVQAGAETLGLGAIVREVTAEREAEEFQRNVLGIVGHDLRNPLSTVLTAARLARRHEAAPAELRTLLDRILRSTGRMERIVSVLLDYTRVRAGTGIPLQRAGCALDALILSVVEEAEGAQPGRKVRTRFEGDGAGEWDPGRVGQAVANLVTNALVHSPPSAGVEVSLRGTDAEVEVAVWNEGPPIAPEALPRLFEPFRRGQPSGENGGQGLGLGLFIARAIVEAHGGAIEARSSAAEGTVFTVRMPRRAGGEG